MDSVWTGGSDYYVEAECKENSIHNYEKNVVFFK